MSACDTPKCAANSGTVKNSSLRILLDNLEAPLYSYVLSLVYYTSSLTLFSLRSGRIGRYRCERPCSAASRRSCWGRRSSVRPRRCTYPELSAGSVSPSNTLSSRTTIAARPHACVRFEDVRYRAIFWLSASRPVARPLRASPRISPKQIECGCRIACPMRRRARGRRRLSPAHS
jgi:hypothetical protein